MEKMNCDNCKADISESKGIPNYRLHLSCSAAPDYGGISLDVLIYPPIDKRKDFCGFGCLQKWMEKEGK